MTNKKVNFLSAIPIKRIMNRKKINSIFFSKFLEISRKIVTKIQCNVKKCEQVFQCQFGKVQEKVLFGRYC